MLNPDGPAAPTKKKSHSQQMSDLITSQTNGRKPSSPTSNERPNPLGQLFNPKAKIDESQIDNRTSDFMDAFLEHLLRRKEGVSYDRAHPGNRVPTALERRLMKGSK